MTSGDSSARFQPGPDVEKSPADPREYRALTLSNQLSVLLVSDAKSKEGAAALNVLVGHASDPAEYPGLAHFLEHAIFLGTEKYPEEDGFSNFVSSHGGSQNAFTSIESTNYHFDIAVGDVGDDDAASSPSEEPLFKEGLRRFAQLVIAPLFTDSGIGREVNAVDSEHQGNLQSDGWRIQQLDRHLSNKEHPFSKFGTGSLATLDTPQTRDAVVEFYNTHYSANRMQLCVTAPYSLEVLQDWTVNLFSDIPNKDVKGTDFSHISPFLPSQRGRICYSVPVNDIRTLSVSWVLPPQRSLYRSDPGGFVSSLISQWGSGSLLSLLKEQKWVDDVDACVSEGTADFSRLSVDFDLTQTGIKHIDDILTLLYGYIGKIQEKGIEQWRFDEVSALAKLSFRCMEPCAPLNLAIPMSEAMSLYPTAEWITGQYLYSDYDPKAIRTILACLKPDIGNVTVVGKFVDSTDQSEPWYGTEFRTEKISPSQVALWQSATCDPKLHLPPRNPFVPKEESLKILGEPLPEGEVDEDGPTKVLSNEYGRLYHKLDRTFRIPKSALLFNLQTPIPNFSPQHWVQAQLFSQLIDDSLEEYSCDIGKAGLHFGFDVSDDGFRASVHGYSHGLEKLLNVLLDKLANFKDSGDMSRFEIHRENMDRAYDNAKNCSPQSRANTELLRLICTSQWTYEECLTVLRDGSITAESVKYFAGQCFRNMHMIGFSAGNADEATAVGMFNEVQARLKFSPLPQSQRWFQRIVQIPHGHEYLLRASHTNADENNSAVRMYFQLGKMHTIQERVTVSLLGDAIDVPTFTELRTKQQLGYSVCGGISYLDRVYAVGFYVQSNSTTPDDICERIDAFLPELRRTALEKDLSDEKFASFVDSSIAQLEDRETMFEQASRFYAEIRSGDYEYNRRRKTVDAFRTAKKEHVLELFDKMVAEGSEGRRRVISMVYGKNHPIPTEGGYGRGIHVKNLIAFQNSMSLYPISGKEFTAFME